MGDVQDAGAFKYSYSAKGGAEARKILEKYEPKREPSGANDIVRLREIDKKASRRALSLSLSLGIGGLAIIALGILSIPLFGKPLLVAVLLMVAGADCCLAAWPLYNHTIEVDRESARPEVIELAERISKGV